MTPVFQKVACFFSEKKELATTVTNTAHFYLSLCSINTKLHACVVFSGDTETR